MGALMTTLQEKRRSVTMAGAGIFYPNVRDHRWLPVARSVPVERSGTSTEREAGSHSVDRIV